MCLAFYRKIDAAYIPDALLEDAVAGNPHGWGLVWWDAQQEIIMFRKGMNMREFIPLYRDLEKQNLSIVAHLRFATHGSQNLLNCHPFPIEGMGVMVHNGVFSGYTEIKEDMSDTWHIARIIERVLAMYRDEDLSKDEDLNFEELTPRLADAVVKAAFTTFNISMSWNKLIIMLENGGEVALINEAAGKWLDDVWYSNDYNFPSKSKSYSQLSMPAHYRQWLEVLPDSFVVTRWLLNCFEIFKSDVESVGISKEEAEFLVAAYPYYIGNLVSVGHVEYTVSEERAQCAMPTLDRKSRKRWMKRLAKLRADEQGTIGIPSKSYALLTGDVEDDQTTVPCYCDLCGDDPQEGVQVIEEMWVCERCRADCFACI